jgi:hypothetical protein
MNTLGDRRAARIGPAIRTTCAKVAVPKHVLILRRPAGVGANTFTGDLVGAACRAGLVDAVIDLATPSDMKTGPSTADAMVVWQSDAPDGLRTAADALADHAEIIGGYAVHEILHWDDAPGVLTGYTMVACSCRLPVLSPEQFIDRYLAHAAIARVHHPAIRRYTQLFVTAALDGSRHCEAIALLHFASADDYARHLYRDEQSRQVVAEDLAGFMDRSRIWAFFTTDRIVVTHAGK